VGADADIAAARALLAELAARREDARLAAGDLLLPIPDPGSDLARVAIANRLLSQENARLRDLVRSLGGEPWPERLTAEQDAALRRPLDELLLDLPVRAENAVVAALAGHPAPCVVACAATLSRDLLTRGKNCGKVSLRAIEAALAKRGLRLGMDVRPDDFRDDEPAPPDDAEPA
jgi:hypothetical protein